MVKAIVEIEETTPMINVSYNIHDDLMVYGTYSEGFKSGGYTQRVFPAQAEAPSFSPEYVDSYELGFKYTSENSRFRLNGSVFRADYSDLQINTLTGIDVTMRNAGDAQIDGFELEATFVPNSHWLLEGSVGYLDAGYEKGTLSPEAIAGGVLDSNDLVNAPELSVSGAVAYTHNFSNGADLIIRTDVSHQSEIYNDATNAEVIRQGHLTLVNVSASYETNEAWRISAGITNLTDQKYWTSAFQHIDPFGLAEVTYARPKEWWLKVTYVF